MNVDTLCFSQILEANNLYDLNYFFTRTAFVIAHKNERLETLLGVIWYLPINSPILIVTNCPETEKEELACALTRQLQHRQSYLIHQKDPALAHFFAERGVQAILGSDGKVASGKGEGMYIGALIARLLGYPEWIIFYDADNFVPNALMEYTLAMSRLFMEEYMTRSCETEKFHNVRICWSSKPALGCNCITPGIAECCTQVVSSIMTKLLAAWFDIEDRTIISANAGEQGFAMDTLQALRFSSGYSIETFQLLDLLAKALLPATQLQPAHVILQQYQAQSPHFHEQRDTEHIKRLIAESLGSFYCFQELLPADIVQQLRQTQYELSLQSCPPLVYPALRELSLEKNERFVNHYRLFEDNDTIDQEMDICS
ncbi:MAG: hypothetical protein E6J34_05415 [Chloroflexi bacterium]|nr:MAG: hypothetical protein E6J34_05415 [Chloroflexota bacterium]